jgi:hypothetical protein
MPRHACGQTRGKLRVDIRQYKLGVNKTVDLIELPIVCRADSYSLDNSPIERTSWARMITYPNKEATESTVRFGRVFSRDLLQGS